MFNIELAEQVLEEITKRPEGHDQEYYRRVNCQTTMCIAGWAADLAGGEWVDESLTTATLLAEPADPEKDCYVGEDGVRYIGAHQRARRLLGLSEWRADDMFEALPNGEAVAMLRRSIRAAKAGRTRRAKADA
jgi:hypothetical protein